jgi:hypothetical protein
VENVDTWPLARYATLKGNASLLREMGKPISSASMMIGFPLLYLAALNGQMGPLLDDYYPLLPTQEVVLGL